MKHLSLLVLILLSGFTYADGLDQMKIYVNHQLVATIYEGSSQNLEFSVSKGDTLSFAVWTDWGGMEESSIKFFDHRSSEELAHLVRIKDGKYEAGFQQIIQPDLMESELLLVFN
ncbi:hypothetical protein, partial [Fluviicola sp.]|uniref:hypothetical protein n=1 Tax=Fluviicola sp. TaxID=1917219 RepID=UPI0026043581